MQGPQQISVFTVSSSNRVNANGNDYGLMDGLIFPDVQNLEYTMEMETQTLLLLTQDSVPQ